MIISFSGLDGAGKTTQAKLLVKHLNKNGFKTSYVHMQHRSIFGIISKILDKHSKNSFKKINNIEFDLENRSLSKKIISFLRKVTYILDLFIFYFYILFKKLQGRIIVCDRYFDDLVVQSIYLNLFGKLFSKFYLNLTPKPTIRLFLEIKPKLGFKRAKEKNITFFDKKNNLYKTLNINFVKIKVNSINKTRGKIIRLVNNKLYVVQPS